MKAQDRLPIYEEILLLALDDDKGTTGMGAMFANAMGGAVLAELAMLGALKVGKDKKAPVTAVAKAPVTDPLLAECLALVAAEKKPKKAVHWVTKFAGLKDLKHRTARQLVDKGVLDETSDKVLGIFPRTIYPESDAGPERELRDRLKKAVFTSTSQVEARTIVVVALAQAAGMLPQIFDKKKLKTRKQRLEKLTSGQVAGAATKEAVEAIQAAMMVAVMVPVFVASS